MYLANKVSLLLWLFVITTIQGIAQSSNRSNMIAGKSKPALGLKTIYSWMTAGGGQISSSGDYVSYTVNNSPNMSYTLVVQSVNGGWKKEIVKGAQPSFTANGKYFFYMTNDSLVSIHLPDKKYVVIPGVSEYTLMGPEFLLYKYKNQPSTLIAKNILTNSVEEIPASNNYLPIQPSKLVLTENTNSSTISVQIHDVVKKKSRVIWNSVAYKPGKYSVSNDAQYLVFLAEGAQATDKQLWKYKMGSDSASKIVDNNSLGDSYYVSANRFPEFSKNNAYVFLGSTLKSIASATNETSVDLISTMDQRFLNLKPKPKSQPKNYVAAVSLSDGKCTVIEQAEDEEVISKAGDFAVLQKGPGLTGFWEASYNSQSVYTYYLVSLKDGSRKLIKEQVNNLVERPMLSPTGKWVVYYDTHENNFLSYNTQTGVLTNFTKQVDTRWADQSNDKKEAMITWWPSLATWLKNDEWVLMYDNYDIWLVDPQGRLPAKNITHGIGQKEKIKFKLLETETDLNNVSAQQDRAIILDAFNTNNKDRGFYTVNLNNKELPKLCSSGPYQYGTLIWDQDDVAGLIFAFQQAKGSKTWLVTRMSATDYPNYFVTKDFTSFTPITNFQPQKAFNWYTSELHNWKSLDGSLLQGILYKPDDFDSTKKYPVIFYYYEKRSDGLNINLIPKPSEGPLNIPLFVSNGYLVFTPDIEFKMGMPGVSAYNAVSSAANYLSQFSWIDTNKMGLQGHSWGGYETNFIVTQTNRFKAACAAAGMTDFTSWYGSGTRGPYAIYHTEMGQGRMGVAPWEDPEAYMKNSPIFYANKVTTPLLFMHNKGDRQVPFSQSIEFFSALRRLGKSAWLLQYENGGHSVDRGADAEDFQVRMMEFFDHFLKGKEAPQWLLLK